MFKVGKNITLNTDQWIEFKGENDAGEEIRIGSIKGSIKDNTKGADQSVITIIGRKDGQHKPLITIANNAIYFHHEVPLCLQNTGGKKTFIYGKSSTKRNINLPDDNGELMINNNGKVMASDLPTSDPSNAGQLWNDSGTVKISAG
tara:strand:- start:3285 stop:3722 length:438 start_codon:yes stop_codon:yes gene_type:complete